MPQTTNKPQNQADQRPEDLELIPTDELAPDYGEIWARWTFPEHIKHQRGRKWYIVFAIILLSILALSLFGFNITIVKYAGAEFPLTIAKSPIFATFIILCIITYIISEFKATNMIDFAITQDGLVINNKLTKYEDLDSFYIIYYPPEIKNLYIQPKNSFKQLINIRLEDMNPVEIRQILLNYIKEDLEKEEIPLSDGLAHRLKL